MLVFIVIVIDAPSAWSLSNHHGMRDAVGWGHPPYQFSLHRDPALGAAPLRIEARRPRLAPLADKSTLNNPNWTLFGVLDGMMLA
jgi:hypothetical protein